MSRSQFEEMIICSCIPSCDLLWLLVIQKTDATKESCNSSSSASGLHSSSRRDGCVGPVRAQSSANPEYENHCVVGRPIPTWRLALDHNRFAHPASTTNQKREQSSLSMEGSRPKSTSEIPDCATALTNALAASPNSC